MPEHNSDDKARILMNIATETSGSYGDEFVSLPSGWRVRVGVDGSPRPQFVPRRVAELIGLPLQAGDIVRCKTNARHPWGISELVDGSGGDRGEWVLAEIGTGRLCDMSNEDVDVLRFVPKHLLYSGKLLQLYRWATDKAFSPQYNPKADYLKRCGGVEFDGDTMHVWSRPHVWTAGKTRDGYPQPRKFSLRWNGKTRLKDIVSAMIEQGFGEEFEYAPLPPTTGMGGIASFTREDVERVVGGIAGNGEVADA